MPIQVSDSFTNILSARIGWDQFFAHGFSANAFLRPFLWVENKVVFDLSNGRYFAWFRGAHVLQVVLTTVCFVACLRPRTWRECAVVPLGLAALIGMHTFQGNVVEALPVNTYLSVLIFCLAAAALALGPPALWVDVAAAALFIVASLTVETGLLVWVIFVGAALVGGRGLSRGGLTVMVLLLVGYFVLRFGVQRVGAPGLVERSSGYGFAVLDPPELIARFGASPWRFYAYNVLSSVSSVLFAEPRAGVFRAVDAARHGALAPWQVLSIVGSAAGTVVVAADIWLRRRGWLAWRFDRDDRVVALFLGVLAANAVISYPYTKDVIMGPAGAFFAAALAVSARRVLLDRPWPGARQAVALALCLALSVPWAVRYVGLHVNLRIAALKEANDWVYESSRMRDQGVRLDPDAQRIFDQLTRDALVDHAPPAQLWLRDLRMFDIY
jgi:hypothetical protein